MSTPDSDRSRLPAAIRALVEDAERIHAERDESLAGELCWSMSIPSDPVAVYDVLQSIPSSADRCFLEWGSGIGTYTLMAVALGFVGHGIEIDPELVGIAQDLSTHHGLPARFVTGTFVPRWFEDDPETTDPDLRSHISGEDGYEQLGLEMRDFDVVYAFPWPGEEAWYQDIFEQGARPGTLYVCNLGDEGIRVIRHG